jgi:hypothetical protein
MLHLLHLVMLLIRIWINILSHIFGGVNSHTVIQVRIVDFVILRKVVLTNTIVFRMGIFFNVIVARIALEVLIGNVLVVLASALQASPINIITSILRQTRV